MNDQLFDAGVFDRQVTQICRVNIDRSTKQRIVNATAPSAVLHLISINRWLLNVSISGTCKMYTELFVSDNIFLFKPHVVMKLLRSQALPVVRTEV